MKTHMNEGIPRRKFIAASAALLAMGAIGLTPLAHAATTAPAPSELKPGQYVWQPELASTGPLVIAVRLDEQRVYVYRDGQTIGVSTISSGKDGYPTPTGVFNILQKSRDHKSNLYEDADMPFMQRLTWDGIALHGGRIPGRPASHGCVRLPNPFAEKLFAASKRGDTVIVSDARIAPPRVDYPAMMALKGPDDAAPTPEEQSTAINTQDYWDDNVKGNAAVNVLVSLPEQRLFVLRNGVVMAAAGLQTRKDLSLDGAVLLVMGHEPPPDPAQSDAPQKKRHNWASYPVAGQPQPLVDLEASIEASPEFMQKLNGVLQPGSTVLITSIRPTRRKALARGAAPTERVLESLP